jgi:predicted transcriptional regulator
VTEVQTISWIFLATALASQTQPTNFDSISSVADGINHAIPTHKELQSSLTRLINAGLVIKHGSKYQLTDRGKEVYARASQKTSTVMKIWENLEVVLEKYA